MRSNTQAAYSGRPSQSTALQGQSIAQEGLSPPPTAGRELRDLVTRVHQDSKLVKQLTEPQHTMLARAMYTFAPNRIIEWTKQSAKSHTWRFDPRKWSMSRTEYQAKYAVKMLFPILSISDTSRRSSFSGTAQPQGNRSVSSTIKESNPLVDERGNKDLDTQDSTTHFNNASSLPAPNEQSRNIANNLELRALVSAMKHKEKTKKTLTASEYQMLEDGVYTYLPERVREWTRKSGKAHNSLWKWTKSSRRSLSRREFLSKYAAKMLLPLFPPQHKGPFGSTAQPQEPLAKNTSARNSLPEEYLARLKDFDDSDALFLREEGELMDTRCPPRRRKILRTSCRLFSIVERHSSPCAAPLFNSNRGKILFLWTTSNKGYSQRECERRS